MLVYDLGGRQRDLLPVLRGAWVSAEASSCLACIAGTYGSMTGTYLVIFYIVYKLF